jgi:hypothetical protein
MYALYSGHYICAFVKTGGSSCKDIQRDSRLLLPQGDKHLQLLS